MDLGTSLMSEPLVQAVFSMGIGGAVGVGLGRLARMMLWLSVIVGAIAFVFLQWMRAEGYIPYIDWNLMGEDFKGGFDPSRFSMLWGFLARDVPFAVAMAIGALFGFRK